MTKIKDYTDTQKLAILCAQSAEDKLAENIVLLDLKEIEVAPCEIFVICECASNIQVKSVTENIIRNIIDHDLTKPKVEGLEEGEWVILDFFDVVVHIMLDDKRDYYKIEKLWADADFYNVNDEAELIETSYESIKQELEKADYED